MAAAAGAGLSPLSRIIAVLPAKVSLGVLVQRIPVLVPCRGSSLFCHMMLVW